MRTEREPQSGQKTNQGSSRGVRRLKPRIGRPKPWGVQWGERVWDERTQKEARKVRTEFFESAELRDERAAELREMKKTGTLRTMSRQEIEQWFAFKAATNGTPWPTVVAGWKSYLLQNGLAESTLTVDEHFEGCRLRAEKLVKAERLGADTYRQKRHKLKLFRARYGSEQLAAITQADVEAWLASHKINKGGTYNNYLKHVRAAFQEAVRAKLIRENPCDLIDKMDEEAAEERHLSVEETAQLLHTALTWKDAHGDLTFKVMLCRLALEFFAGVRFGSATRLIRGDVNIEDRGILHPKKSIKTRRRQYVEGFPDVLWTWLAIAPIEGWALTPRQYLDLKSRLFFVAGVPHPSNCARHSFCTYHMAVQRDAALTATLLCHVNPRKLWDTYKGNATRAEGRRYLGLMPRTVSEVAREFRLAKAQRGQGVS